MGQMNLRFLSLIAIIILSIYSPSSASAPKENIHRIDRPPITSQDIIWETERARMRMASPLFSLGSRDKPVFAYCWGNKYSEYHYDLIKWLAPVFYCLIDSEGTIGKANAWSDEAIGTFVQYVHQKEDEVIAVLQSWGPEGGNYANEVLSNPSKATRLVENIYKLCQAHQFEGINIDFEGVQASNRGNLSNFIEELVNRLHPSYSVSLALLGKTSVDWGQAYDYQTLGELSDLIVIMAYDYHWRGSDPGAIAPLPWVKGVSEYALSKIPRNKILLGAPFYGYDWPQGPDDSWGEAEALLYEEVLNLATLHQMNILWDEEDKAPYFNYSAGGEFHEVWFNDGRSLEPKLGLVQEYSLGGIAIWRLVGEDPDNWTVIENWKGFSEEEEEERPLKLLESVINFPNPSYEGKVTFHFILKEEALLKLKIYNIAGELVYSTEIEGAEGKNDFFWEGKNSESEKVASGLYIYRVEAKGASRSESCTKKLVIIK